MKVGKPNLGSESMLKPDNSAGYNLSDIKINVDYGDNIKNKPDIMIKRENKLIEIKIVLELDSGENVDVDVTEKICESEKCMFGTKRRLFASPQDMLETFKRSHKVDDVVKPCW